METLCRLPQTKGDPLPEGWEAARDGFACMSGKVSTRQKELLDKPLSSKELEKALYSLPNGKAPGRDGFTKEFMVRGWGFIEPILMEAVAQIWQQGSMGRTLNESLITLLPKLNAEESVKN